LRYKFVGQPNELFDITSVFDISKPHNLIFKKI